MFTFVLLFGNFSIESTPIKSIQYEEKEKKLEVQYERGEGEYRLYNVPKEEYNYLMELGARKAKISKFISEQKIKDPKLAQELQKAINLSPSERFRRFEQIVSKNLQYNEKRLVLGYLSQDYYIREIMPEKYKIEKVTN